MEFKLYIILDVLIKYDKLFSNIKSKHPRKLNKILYNPYTSTNFPKECSSIFGFINTYNHLKNIIQFTFKSELEWILYYKFLMSDIYIKKMNNNNNNNNIKSLFKKY